MKRKPAAPSYAPLFPYLGMAQNAVLAPGELVIDNFAGIGGASTGMANALGRPVDHAINHDPVAVSLHQVNYPHSHHSVEDVWQVDPREVVRGQPVALCWFSPTCTDFSKAKGAALLDRGIRGLAWVAVRWAALVRPRVIILENVEEFQQWSPLTAEGKRDPARKGRTFNSFVNALCYQGYHVEWRELRACDYGTPTIRKRLFLIARRDGLPIIWPEATHAAPTDARVVAGQLKPYRTAASCIDWGLPCPSIFDRKKPLVRNTLNRVAQGMFRYVLKTERPFIVTCNHGGEGFRGQGVDRPFVTVTAANEAHGVVDPFIAKLSNGDPRRFRGQRIDEGLATVTGAKEHALVLPVLAACVVNKQHQAPARPADAPLSTVTTNHNKNELLVGSLVTYYGQKTRHEARGGSPEKPVGTQTTENRHALTTAHLVSHNGGGLDPKYASYAADKPARTVLALGGPQALVTGSLLGIDNGSSRSGNVWKAQYPLSTILTENRHAVLSGALVACGGRGAQARLKALNECIHTITGKADMCLTTAYLSAYYGNNGRNDQGQPADAALRTIPTNDRFGLTLGTLVRHFGTSTAADVDAPSGTIVGTNKTGLVQAEYAPALTPAQLSRARQAHNLLLEFLGDALAPYSQGGLVVLQVRGEWYVLVDIGMRMLSPRELARCQGFPDIFILDRDAEGRAISKARQVRGIGNSVCPQMAEVLTRAQLSVAMQDAAD